jgi:hypothetical protein
VGDRKQPDPTGPEKPRTIDRLTIAILFAVTIGLGFLVDATLKRRIEPMEALAAHIAIMCAWGALILVRPGRDVSSATVGWLATLCAGPVGSGFALMLMLGVFRPRGVDLAPLYATFESVRTKGISEAISAEIIDGRVLQPKLDAQLDFRQTITAGPLAERQALLGLIGLKYHPIYFDILQLALQSPEATIRVQAAATYSKLLATYRAKLRQALDAAAAARDGSAGSGSDSVAETLKIVAAITEALASRFIDAAETRRVRSVAQALCEQLLAQHPDRLDLELTLLQQQYDAAAYDQVCTRLEPRIERGDILPAAHLELFKSALLRLGRTRDYVALLQRSPETMASTGMQVPRLVASNSNSPGPTAVRDADHV